MKKQKRDNLPLSPYRALDLTDEKGHPCGKILADLGVDVIKVEPPEGDPGRNIGPFYHDIPDKNKSLYYFAYNTNKRSITLNIEARDGQEIFRKLAATADFVIESFAPGNLNQLGLGYPALKKINPRLIMVSITPFGQSGPYHKWKDSDIVAIAMGGLSHIMGSPDRPPVRIGVDQSYMIAGAQAAMGAMIAHYHCQATGKGQQVDTSIQESVVISALTVPQAYDLQGFIQPRVGGCIPRSGKRVRFLWPCKDGFVSWRIFGGGLGVKTRAIVEWMESLGQAGDLSEVDWEQMNYLTTAPDVFDHWQDLFIKFFKTRTKEEICREALNRGVVLFPVSTPKDLLEDVQTKARDFWQEVDHPELDDKIIYPGALYKSSEFSMELHRAPLIGEHNKEVYEEELGLSKESLAILKKGGVI